MSAQSTYTPLERITEAAMRNALGDEAAVCVLLEGDDDAAMIATLFGLLLSHIAAVAHYQRISFEQAVSELALRVHTNEALAEREAQSKARHPSHKRDGDI